MVSIPYRIENHNQTFLRFGGSIQPMKKDTDSSTSLDLKSQKYDVNWTRYLLAHCHEEQESVENDIIDILVVPSKKFWIRASLTNAVGQSKRV